MVLLLVWCFGVGSRLWTEQIAGERISARPSVLKSLLGDSRRLFANHFFIKADEYFHAGYYPSIFDQAATDKKGAASAATTGAVTGDSHAGEVEWMNKPHDWIERFSRNFFPSDHVHLDTMDDDHGHDDHEHDHDHGHSHGHSHGHGHATDGHDGASGGSMVREILPWLRISAELDPNRVETYLTGSYWLRKRMNRTAEAKEFIRDGLRANPRSYELTFELARIYHEHHEDTGRARNLFNLALRYWNDSQRLAEEPDNFMLAQILVQLATLERIQGNPDRALELYQELRKVSPFPESIDRLISDTREGKPPTALR
ncbi:MAG TPA: hypothetical protein DCY13_02765 [Verrucomicrobiales bacterium]|nr:hypothetical protein [Verrucomicrobiales bacterium]